MGWDVSCTDLFPKDCFLLSCCRGGDMWGLWVGICIFPCPGCRNNLEALDEFLKLVGLKVRQGFGVGTWGGHLWLLCCWALVPDVPGIIRQGHGWRSVSGVFCRGHRQGGRRERGTGPKSLCAATLAILLSFEIFGWGRCMESPGCDRCPGLCWRCCRGSGIIRWRRVISVGAVGSIECAVARSSNGFLRCQGPV